MQEDISFIYQDTGFHFPFMTYTFELGPFLISQRNMILFKNYGVEKSRDKQFKFNQFVGITDDEAIMDKIEHFWGQGTGGFHLKLKLPGMTFTSTCKEKKGPNKTIEIQYISRINDTVIGDFTLDNGEFEVVRGHYKRSQQERSWFIGISLLKLSEIKISETSWGD